MCYLPLEMLSLKFWRQFLFHVMWLTKSSKTVLVAIEISGYESYTIMYGVNQLNINNIENADPKSYPVAVSTMSLL